jgi:hypothetical protein
LDGSKFSTKMFLGITWKIWSPTFGHHNQWPKFSNCPIWWLKVFSHPSWQSKFLGINKFFCQSLDQWSLLIKQLKFFGELPMFSVILKKLIVICGDQKLVTKKFWLSTMVSESWWPKISNDMEIENLVMNLVVTKSIFNCHT